MEQHEVVVAGGGPTGLMLAGELALAGTDVVIVERRPDQELDGSRAGGLLSRTIEVLDQRGIAERFLEAGQTYPVHGFAMIPLDISDLPTRHPYVLGLPQRRFEPILADWVASLGVPFLRAQEVVGLAQDDDGVDVHLAGGTQLRTQYLVGCDGGRSAVRRAAGIPFTGSDATLSWLIAEFDADEEPPLGIQHDEVGFYGITRMGPGEPLRTVITERHRPSPGEPDLDTLRAAFVERWGTDFGVRDAAWVSRFSDVTRQAEAYRSARVLVAGDAAHIHAPTGGQGLNTGVQDAVNLGWKLAQVVRGTSPVDLLDTYHVERHPVGARVLANTLAQVALNRRDDRSQALRATMVDLLAMDEPRHRIAGMLLALDVHYDLGEGHPLLGRRLPDLALETADRPTRASALLHDARPVLLQLDGTAPVDLGPWTDRVRSVTARADDEVELPVLGRAPTPPAVLIRPDGHVAWTGATADPGLTEALARWFGAAA